MLLGNRKSLATPTVSNTGTNLLLGRHRQEPHPLVIKTTFCLYSNHYFSALVYRSKEICNPLEYMYLGIHVFGSRTER